MLIHRYVDDHGKRHVDFVKEFNYELYLKSDYTVDAQDIHKNSLKRYTFNTLKDMAVFVRDNGKDNIYGNIDPVSQFITKTYPNEIKLTNDYVTLNFDIETVHGSGKPKYRYNHIVTIRYDDGREQTLTIHDMKKVKQHFLIYDEDYKDWKEYADSCYAPQSLDFPNPYLALYEVLSISLISSQENVIYVFGTEEYKGKRVLENYTINHIKVVDEKELLIEFLRKWREIKPDIVTGWNCIPLTNSVWKTDRIIDVGSVAVKDKLYDSFVEHVYPHSYKDCYNTTLENGLVVSSSFDHVFPIYYKPKDSYITNLETLVVSDSKVSDMVELLNDNHVYTKVNLNDNNNDDLTYESLFDQYGDIIDIDKSYYKGIIDANTLSLVGYSFINNLNNQHWLYELFINKDVGKTVLSLLSYQQFKSFISDQMIFKPRLDMLDTLSELLLWNGMFCTILDNKVSIYDHECDNWFKDGDSYYVRIKSIENTHEKVEMIDLSTNTHYFVTGGVTTHNCDGFDIPYIINRIINVLGEKYVNLLSPASKESKNCIRESQKDDKVTYEIIGITVYDYMDLYKKFMRDKKESYKLDFIGQVEVDHRKISFPEYNDSLMLLWEYDYNKFIEYNAVDTLIVNKLDDKLKYINLAITIAHITKTNLSNALGTVKIWDDLIFSMLTTKGIQIPPNINVEKDAKFIGAYVKVPILGAHGWVITFDLTSLYPNIIRMLGLSPETLLHRQVGGNSGCNTKQLSILNRNLDIINDLISIKKKS